MKTIQDAANEILRKEYSDFNRNAWHYKSQFEMLIEMGKFAQRWIPVEEELPESEANGLSKVVICKGEFLADEFSAYYDSIRENWKLYPSAKIIQVAKWRPIELNI